MTILTLASALSGGGMERDHFFLSSELVRMGHSVHVAYLYEGPTGSQTAQGLAKNGVVLHRLRASNNHDPMLIFQVVGLIRRVKPDILHTWQLQADILGWIVSRLTRRPCIITEPSCAKGHPNTWKERLRLLLGAGCAGIVSNSAGGEEYWRSRSPQSVRYIVPNGFPLEEISVTPPASPADIGLPSGQKYLLYAGRLVPGKGLDKLMEALAQVMTQLPITAVFCGDGPLQESLEKQAWATGTADRVRFVGFVSNTRIWSFMKSAEAFVFPSEFEGMPNVVFEAMACGCPLIVSDIPAHREFLDENMTLFVDPYDPCRIAAAIRQSLSDPQKAQVRAKAAREEARKYTLSDMARSYERVYRDVLGRHGKRTIGTRKILSCFFKKC